MANFTALKTAINNAIRTNGNEEITGAVLQVILDAMVETLGDSAINNLETALATEVTNRENAVGGVAGDLAAEALARANKDNQLDGRINQEEYNRQNADAALSQTMSQGFQTLGSQMTALNAAISALNAAYQNGYLYGGIATPSSSPSNNKCFYIALQGGTYTNFGGVGVVEGINIIKNDSGWKVEHIYDQTTLLNEFYLLRQQVIQAITSFAPIVIEGDVTNAPDEEDLTSNANHLLQFKNNAYSPLEFSGLGRKYLRKNIAPLSESAPFNGFVEGVTAEETLSGTPTQIFWDRMNTRFVGIKDGVYYLDWTGSDNYVPVSTSLVYMYNGTPYQWTGSDFIVDETEVPNLVNCLTQDMINEANTIYIIRYDYTLKEDITIPANCVLQFDGGSLSNGTIVGNNTNIAAGVCKIFGDNLILSGTYNNVEAYAEWFGAKGDGVTDDADDIQKALDFGWDANLTVMLLAKKYLIKKPLVVWCHFTHDYTDNIERSHVKGNGQYNTFIIKDGFVGEEITRFRDDCAFLLADYRVRTEGLVPDDDNCIANALIEDLSISSTSSDLQNPDNETAIFFIGACFSEFRNISIYGFRRGFTSVKYTYGMKFVRVDVHFPHVAFDFGNSIGAAASQTCLYFEGCHTNGCSVSDYNLQAAATLITCAKDGGAGPFVKTFYRTMSAPGLRPRITMIDCHEETPVCSEIFTLEAATLHIVGGIYETSLNATIFSAIKDSLVIVDGATFYSRNETNMETCLLYKTEDISRIYFRNNVINNTLFSTQQVLKNQTKLLFDVGVDEIVDYVENGGATLSHEIVDNVLQLSVEDASEATIYVYFGQINTSLYNAIRVYMESVDWQEYTQMTVVYSDEVDENHNPTTGYKEEVIGFSEAGTRVNANNRTFPDGILKGSVLGCQLPDVGKKHLFICMYAAGSAKSSVKIFKVELI